VWLLFAARGTAGAAVGFDSQSSTQGNSSTFVWSHTVGNRLDRIMVVGVSIFSGNKAVAGITYGGQSLTLIGARNGGSGADNRRIEMWYLLAPPVGTANINLTMENGSKLVAGAATFYGVDPTTPLGVFASNEGISTLLSVNVTTAPGELVVDCVATKGRALSVIAAAGQTQIWNDVTRTNGGNIIGAASYRSPTSATETMSWTTQSAEYWAIGAVPLKPAPPPPYLVDAMIKLASEADSAYLTDDLYESAALVQSKSLGVLSGQTAVYAVQMQNDGLNDDRFLVSASPPVAGFSVQYLDGSGADRTAEVTGPGFLDTILPGGASTVWNVYVTPDGSPNPTAGGATQLVELTAVSSGDPTRVDQVGALTTCVSPALAMAKSADKATAAPGEDIAYSIVAASAAGLTDATSIVVVDTIPANTGFRLGSATFATGTSGLTSSIEFSNDNGATWNYTPADGACGAPAGYDYCVTHIRWTLNGAMPASRSFELGLAVRVK